MSQLLILPQNIKSEKSEMLDFGFTCEEEVDETLGFESFVKLYKKTL